MKILTLILLTCSITCHLWADNLSNLNGGFNNLGSKTKTLSVRCFTQDSTGMVWFGTSRGLYSYDGYDIRHYVSDTLLTSTRQMQFYPSQSYAFRRRKWHYFI